MSKKVSRRDFARTSVAAGAAAVALPGALLGKTPTDPSSAALLKGAAAAQRRRLVMPPDASYGGYTADGREILLQDTLTPAGQTAPSYPAGWQEGTTIPGEYYVDPRHYEYDEQFIADNFWLLTDHASRIPNAGDYFVFEFGRGDSVIILRNRAGEVKAYHNVCRHRGSRVCMHGSAFDNVRPSEAREDGKPIDPRLSVTQLGGSGNTPVFRCVYHSWTYDLDGKLVSYPPGMPAGFNPEEHGLHPVNLRTVGGFIYINLGRQEPPDFDAFTTNMRYVCDQFQTLDLKVIARKSHPTKANWKLVVENFRECYHCQPAHTRSFYAVHTLFGANLSSEERARIEQEVATHGHPGPGQGGPPPAQSGTQEELDALLRSGGAGSMGGAYGGHLQLGFVTGSMDGKLVAPRLPARQGQPWSHRRVSANSGFSTGFMAAYEDHVAIARFTPRDVNLTDAEIFYLVAPDAREEDVDIDRMIEVWDLTYREDRWIVENNHNGIRSRGYNYYGGQPYAAREGSPAGFVKWYMAEVARAPLGTQTDAL